MCQVSGGEQVHGGPDTEPSVQGQVDGSPPPHPAPLAKFSASSLAGLGEEGLWPAGVLGEDQRPPLQAQHDTLIPGDCQPVTPGFSEGACHRAI